MGLGGLLVFILSSKVGFFNIYIRGIVPELKLKSKQHSPVARLCEVTFF
jgi:hypothetical protein